MESKNPTHTPGPWKSGPQPNGCIRGTEHLKSVWAEKLGSLNGDRVEYCVAENCDEGDARLIAAAPELLAYALYEADTMSGKGFTEAEYKERAGVAYRMRRAAIRRATEGA